MTHLHQASRRSESGIPSAETPLVGRSDDLARARELLADRKYLEVLGPPGVGKTRFALELAKLEQANWDEVFWIPLQPADDAVRLAAYVARGLGISAHMMRHSDLLEAMIDRGQSTLIVLDNAEHVAAEAQRLVRALNELADVAVIVTSRDRIDAGAAVELAGLRPADALEVFEAFRSASTSPDERDDLQAFVQRVQGLPLALRLGASRLDVLTPRQLLETPGGGALSDAVQTSWDRLADAERQTLGALAAFRGGADALTLATITGLGEEGTLAAVAELRRRSLVETQDVDRRRRFSLLAAIQEFVAEAYDVTEFRNRHAQHFAMWGLSVDEASRSMKDDMLTRRLAQERSNLAAAARWAIANDDMETAAAALVGLAVAAEISGFADDVYKLGKRVWEHREELRESRFLCAFGAMLSDSDRMTFAEEVFRYVESHSASVASRLAALRGLSRCVYRHADLSGARELTDRAVAEARATGDLYELAVSRRVWAAVRAVSSEPEGAAEALEDAAGVFREFGALRDEAQCEYLLAWHFSAQERPAPMLASARRAADAAELLGDVRLDLEARWLLGVATADLGEVDEAQRIMERLLEDSRRAGVLDSIRCTAETLVNIHVERGNLAEARELLKLQGRLANSCAEPVARFWHVETQGELLAHQGDLAAAAAKMDEALARPVDYWNASLAVGANCHRSTVAFALGDFAGGEAALARAEKFVTAEDSVGLQMLWRIASAGRAIGANSPEVAGSAMEPLVRMRQGYQGWDRRSSQWRIQGKLVEANLGRWAQLFEKLVESTDEAIVAADGGWFRTADGTWVSLRLRLRLVAMLACLARHEVASVDVIAAEVWEGELMTPSSALNRIRATISMLRSEGLGDVIQHNADGYLLDRERCYVYE